MAENDWTSAQVAKYPHRLIGFCSVNPLRPYAVDAGAPFSHYAKILMWVRYSSSNPRIQNLRSWPVTGFETIRIYYALAAAAMHIIRILHGKRDVRRIL
jgi:hypothetical protein